MQYLRLIIYVILAVPASLAQDSAANATCATNAVCRFDDAETPSVNFFTWMPIDELDDYQADYVATVNLTATVVVVVDTVLGTTSTSTELPPEYTPTLNAESTRIQEFTYTSSGSTATSFLTYPTPFVVWPSYYVWDGTLSLPDSSCITAPTAGSTVALTTNPQVEVFFSERSSTAPDPRGLRFAAIQAYGASNMWIPSALATAFPDQLPLRSCGFFMNGGPNWGAFTATGWDTVTAQLWGEFESQYRDCSRYKSDGRSGRGHYEDLDWGGFSSGYVRGVDNIKPDKISDRGHRGDIDRTVLGDICIRYVDTYNFNAW